MQYKLKGIKLIYIAKNKPQYCVYDVLSTVIIYYTRWLINFIIPKQYHIGFLRNHGDLLLAISQPHSSYNQTAKYIILQQLLCRYSKFLSYLLMHKAISKRVAITQP